MNNQRRVRSSIRGFRLRSQFYPFAYRSLSSIQILLVTNLPVIRAKKSPNSSCSLWLL